MKKGIENETKLEEIPEHVRGIVGFEKAWKNYQKWLKEQWNKKCPKCGDQLTKVRDTPEYWMCYRCIKGYTNKELDEK